MKKTIEIAFSRDNIEIEDDFEKSSFEKTILRIEEILRTEKIVFSRNDIKKIRF